MQFERTILANWRAHLFSGVRWAAVAVAAVALLGGCRIRDRDETTPEEEELSTAEQEIVDDTTDLSATTQDASAIAAIPALALVVGKTPPTLARAVELQQAGAALFQPTGCASATAEGNVVTYVLEGCTGPGGIVEVNGRVVAVFRPGPTDGSISIAMHTEDLVVGGHAVEQEVDITLGDVDGGKRLAWSGSVSATTPRGLAVEQTSDLVLVVDEDLRCSTLDGTASSAIGGRRVDARYTDLVLCAPRGTCPSGRIEATAHPRGLTVAIDLDGSRTAVVTTPRGYEVDVGLACLPGDSAP